MAHIDYQKKSFNFENWIEFLVLLYTEQRLSYSMMKSVFPFWLKFLIFLAQRCLHYTWLTSMLCCLYFGIENRCCLYVKRTHLRQNLLRVVSCWWLFGYRNHIHEHISKCLCFLYHRKLLFCCFGRSRKTNQIQFLRGFWWLSHPIYLKMDWTLQLIWVTYNHLYIRL